MFKFHIIKFLFFLVPNKKLLYKAGLHEMSILYILEKSTEAASLPTQFKVLAILRILLQGKTNYFNYLSPLNSFMDLL